MAKTSDEKNRNNDDEHKPLLDTLHHHKASPQGFRNSASRRNIGTSSPPLGDVKAGMMETPRESPRSIDNIVFDGSNNGAGNPGSGSSSSSINNNSNNNATYTGAATGSASHLQRHREPTHDRRGRESPRLQSLHASSSSLRSNASRASAGYGEPPSHIMFGSNGSMVAPSYVISPYGSRPVVDLSSHHRRAGSWSGQNMPPMAPPSPVMAMPQNPMMMPFLGAENPYNHYSSQPLPYGGGSAHNESMALLAAQQQQMMAQQLPLPHRPSSMRQQHQNARRKRKPDEHQHRRSLSSGAAHPGMYGNFFKGDGSYDMPPPPPPPRQSSNEQFSPMSEIRKITSSFRAGGSNSNSPIGPTSRKMSPNLSFVDASNRVTFSPRMSSPVGGTYGSMHGSLSNVPDFSLNGGPGGEAVFMAQKQSGVKQHSHRRHGSESNHKRHMRQQSAQLFMEEVKGVPQPPACKDVVFLLLFLFHIVGIAFLSTTYGEEGFEVTTNTAPDGVELYYYNLMFVALMSGFFAVAVSLLALGLMTAIARKFVQVALCLAAAISFSWGTIGIGLSPKNVVPITGFIALALIVAYTFIVWERIPFCAANLLTALSGMRANLGTLVVAIGFQALSLLYCIYFTFVFVGVYDAIKEGKLKVSHDMQVFIYTMLGVSFYWTFHVILNVVQVTTASVISDWWYDPRSVSVFHSFSRTMFYSLGSICFGSLLVGPVRLIRQLSVIFRPNTDDSSLLCLHQCFHCFQTCATSFVEGLAKHFNPFAFTYVGIYGYGFLDAGTSATELFRTRGWLMIVADDLVPNILLMTSLVIGGATGCFAHLVEQIDGMAISSLGEPGTASFGVGVVLGLVVTSVLFGIISSSVNAVLVCFAASPVDFENNHPELSHEMRAAWREVWPGCMDVVDLRVALANPSPVMAAHPLHMQRPDGGIPPEFL